MRKIINKINIGKHSLFYRMLLYFMTFLIPILIIGISMYINSLNMQKRDFSRMMMMNLKSSAETVDIYLQTAKETSINFLYDSTVQQLLKPHNYLSLEEKSKLSEIPRIISRNQNIVNNFIDSLFVYTDNNKVYTNEGMNEFGVFFSSFYKYEQYNTEFWINMLKVEKYVEILPVSLVGSSFTNRQKSVVPIVTVSKLNGNNTSMVINISVETIYRTVKRNSIFPSTGYIIMDKNNNVIVCDNIQHKNEKVINQIVNHFEDNKKDYYELKIFNEDYVITNLKSDDFGWQYYSVTPAGEFYKQAKGILSMIILLCIAMLAIGSVLAFIFSVRLYNPIKKISDILLDNTGQGIMPYTNKEQYSKNNELDIIGRGISSLVSNQTETAQRIRQISIEYFDNVFESLIRGHHIENEEVLKEMLKNEMGWDKNCSYLCCVFMFDFKDNYYKEIQDVDRLNVEEGIKKIIWTTMDKYVNTYVVEYKNNLFTCILSMDEGMQRQSLDKGIQEIIDCFEYDFNYCELVIGVGKVYADIKDIWESYGEAMTAIENREVDIKVQIIDVKDISVKHGIFYSFTDERKIVNCLKTGDMENLKINTMDIIERNKKNTVSYRYMDALLKELYNTGIRYIAEKGIEVQKFSSAEQYIFGGSSMPDEEDVLAPLLRFYGKIIEQTVNENENKSGSLVSMIMEYVEKNYNKDIYLEKIAEEMGVSVKYISRVFKKKTGTNLTDYISMIRINAAKELLRNTTLNISSISEQVGIYSRSTFSRLFKKFEGTSPGNFRGMANK